VTGLPSARVVVDVVGAVRRPGLYRLEQGSRIADAVARAGGATGKADLVQVNLAAPLADGEQVVVPRRGAAVAAAGAGGSATPGVPTGPVHLSTATLEQLDALPGVGPVTAQKILFRPGDAVLDLSVLGSSLVARLLPSEGCPPCRPGSPPANRFVSKAFARPTGGIRLRSEGRRRTETAPRRAERPHSRAAGSRSSAVQQRSASGCQLADPRPSARNSS
jgi:DNA uptake protein ComE-like DNA-binding protein